MNRLKMLRKEKNLKQSELSKILNISQPNYCKYEKGSVEMTDIFLIKLSDYFDVSIDYICGLTKIRKKYKNISLLKRINRLSSIRKDNNLSQKDVAKVLGIARSTYAEYETGSLPNSNKIIKLAKFYNLPIDYIVCITDEKIINK